MAIRIINRIYLKDIIFNINNNNKRCLYITSKYDKSVEFCLSDIGEGIREVTLKSWHVKINDKVSQFDNICEVESDKATVTITSRYDGIIKKLYYNVDDIANVGKPLVDIEIENDEDSGVEIKECNNIENNNVLNDQDKSSDIVSSENKLSDNISVLNNISSDSFQNNEINTILFNKSLATPAVRRIAMQYNIKLSDVKATGKNNRVLKEDILEYLNNRDKQSELNKLNSSIEKCELKPVTRIMKTMIKTMNNSNNIPTFGYSDDVDFSKLVEIRKKLIEFNNIKITYLPFILKAISKGLFKYPILNSSIDEKFENIIYKSFHNIGIAVDSPSGLIVPNIKNVDKLSILDISNEIQRLQKSAYDNTLKPNDLINGTFSVSNIGAVGGIQGLPLILPPEVSIIAVGKIQKLPRFNSNNDVIAKHIVNFTFSADHRIIDGATVSRFSNLIKNYLENPELLLIEL